MKLHCRRCGHDWLLRQKKVKKRICPKCKSASFEVPRKDWHEALSYVMRDMNERQVESDVEPKRKERKKL